MNGTEEQLTDRIALAEEAARALFDTGNSRADSDYEPRNRDEANAAVRQLGKSFDDLPGTIARVLDAARDTGDLLSDDRFQGLAEIVQNADDTEATCVRMLLNTNELLISHNGKPVHLHHVLGLATPWLSTKGDSVAAIGRFGIGLMTLRSLSDTIEVHCYPYHIRLGEPTLSPIGPPSLPTGFVEEGWTTFRIPLVPGAVNLEDLTKWLDNWDDSALLFLSHVTRIELLRSDGACVRKLSLTRSAEETVEFREDAASYNASRRIAEASDGRSWAVYSADRQSPTGVLRARKATGATTPISVALPLNPAQSGQIYAGLPVAPARAPLFVSAQFDPLTSRRGFADNEWNKALVPLVAEHWAHAVLDLFGRDAKLAWQTVCTGEYLDGDPIGALMQTIEEAVTYRARQWISSHLSLPVPYAGTISLSRLAVEAKPLEGILTDSETAGLADLPATLPSISRDDSGTWRKVLEDWRHAGADLPNFVGVEQSLELLGDEARPVEQTIAFSAAALNEGLNERLLELPSVIADDGRHLIPPSGDSPQAISLKATPLARQLGVVITLHSAYLNESQAANTVLAWLQRSARR